MSEEQSAGAPENKRAHPDDAIAAAQKAVAEGRFDAAEAALDEARKRWPEQQNLILRQAELRIRRGDYAGAETVLGELKDTTVNANQTRLLKFDAALGTGTRDRALAILNEQGVPEAHLPPALEVMAKHLSAISDPKAAGRPDKTDIAILQRIIAGEWDNRRMLRIVADAGANAVDFVTAASEAFPEERDISLFAACTLAIFGRRKDAVELIRARPVLMQDNSWHSRVPAFMIPTSQS